MQTFQSFRSELPQNALSSLMGASPSSSSALSGTIYPRKAIKAFNQVFAESYEKQKQFITDAGHEIKTPLTIIQADADVLEMELGENEWLADIQNNVRRLTDLTNDLVSLARMEEGGTPLELVEMPLSDVVTETAQTFHTLAQAQNKELGLAVEPMLSMDADEKAISKLVGILMDNALKYSPEIGRAHV